MGAEVSPGFGEGGVGFRPGVGEAPPVAAVGGFEVAFFVGPGVPDFCDFAEVANVVVAGEIPEELMQAGFEIHCLGGEEGEAGGEVHFVEGAEVGEGVDAGAGGFADALFEDEADKVEVFLHP